MRTLVSLIVIALMIFCVNAVATEIPLEIPGHSEVLFTATAGRAKQEILYKVKVTKLSDGAEMAIHKGPTGGSASEFRLLKVVDLSEQDSRRFFDLVRAAFREFRFENRSGIDGGTFGLRLEIGSEAVEIEYGSVADLEKRSSPMFAILEWARHTLGQ